MSLLYNTGGAIGSIDVLVNSVDYYGRAVGNLSTQYQFNNYNFEVETIISNSMSLNVIMKDKFIIQQPAPLSCELTVTNLTQSSVDCLLDKLFVFTNVTEGDVYNYTVTVTNVIGSTFKNGSIGIVGVLKNTASTHYIMYTYTINTKCVYQVLQYEMFQ
uniref:Uncharacterized protein n=1 Tax=Amphimedon queenslandica TaxID=400682 RepID=A0A1X7T8R2_AMPQE